MQIRSVGSNEDLTKLGCNAYWVESEFDNNYQIIVHLGEDINTRKASKLVRSAFGVGSFLGAPVSPDEKYDMVFDHFTIEVVS